MLERTKKSLSQKEMQTYLTEERDCGWISHLKCASFYT